MSAGNLFTEQPTNDDARGALMLVIAFIDIDIDIATKLRHGSRVHPAAARVFTECAVADPAWHETTAATCFGSLQA